MQYQFRWRLLRLLILQARWILFDRWVLLNRRNYGFRRRCLEKRHHHVRFRRRRPARRQHFFLRIFFNLFRVWRSEWIVVGSYLAKLRVAISCSVYLQQRLLPAKNWASITEVNFDHFREFLRRKYNISHDNFLELFVRYLVFNLRAMNFINFIYFHLI